MLGKVISQPDKNKEVKLFKPIDESLNIAGICHHHIHNSMYVVNRAIKPFRTQESKPEIKEIALSGPQSE